MEYSAVYCMLMCFLFCAPNAQAQQINECISAVFTNIVDTNPSPSLTCSGLDRYLAVYWSIQRPGGAVSQIGTCAGWYSHTCALTAVGFAMTRGEYTSTLSFSFRQFSNGTVISCQQPGQASTNCSVFFVQEGPLTINECGTERSAAILENKTQPSFTCSRLWLDYNMYWFILRLGEESFSTVGTCLVGDSCTINSNYTGFFNLTRSSGGSVSRLYFNDLQFIDGATVSCSQGLRATAVSCRIQITNPLPRTIKECRPQGSVDIPQDAVQPFFTCSGLWWTQHMYWAIQPPNQPNPTEIGNCETDISVTFSRSYVCSITNSALTGKFHLTRSTNGSVSTLFFNNLQFTDGARIFCNQQISSVDYSTSCRVQVIEPYKLQKCQNGSVEVAVNGARNITCTGLQPAQNMDWIVTLRNRENYVMNCNFCQNNVCPNCTMANDNLRPSRGIYTSQLTLYDTNGDLGGATVTCIKRDEATQDDCQVKTVDPYILPACTNGRIDILEDESTSITCDGVFPLDQYMYWNITYPNGTGIVIASCDSCTASACPQCTSYGDFAASQNYQNKTSKLHIVSNVREYQNARVTCSRADHVLSAECPLNVLTQASQATTAPVAAIAGGVAGAGVLLIIIIVVVIVVVRRRGSKRDRPKQKAQPPQGPSRNSDEFVEFVNDGYMSADQFDGDGRLRAAAATSSADGGGVYSNADAMDTNDTKTNAQNQNIKHETAGNDVYAQVQKKPKGVVNKQDAKKPKGDKKGKAEKPAKGAKSRDAENAKRNDAMAENIYASGTDPSEYYNVSALANTKKDHSGDVYMNVSENSPSTRDGATPGAGADDGVYNELNEQQDRRNPTYNRTT